MVFDYSGVLLDEMKKMGIVGVVVWDKFGNLVVVMFIGGMINKLFGCVGDSLLVGVGCYVNNVSVVVFCIGMGEVFICMFVVYDIVVLMEYGGFSFVDVCECVVMEKLLVLGGSGGLIVVDYEGNVVLLFNSEGMYCVWGYVGDMFIIGIYWE